MQKKLLSEQGFSLTEVLIASAVFSLVIVTYIQLRGLIFQQERVVDEKFNQIKILMTIKDEIVKDDSYIIPYEVPVGTFSDDKIFEDNTKLGFRCYDRDASLKDINYKDDTLDLTALCAYRVAFYKLRVRVPGKARSPLSQYHIKVNYFVGTGTDRREETTFLRPFITSVQYN